MQPSAPRPKETGDGAGIWGAALTRSDPMLSSVPWAAAAQGGDMQDVIMVALTVALYMGFLGLTRWFRRF